MLCSDVYPRRLDYTRDRFVRFAGLHPSFCYLMPSILLVSRGSATVLIELFLIWLISYAQLYATTAREMRRLDSVTKSPIFSLYGEASESYFALFLLRFNLHLTAQLPGYLSFEHLVPQRVSWFCRSIESTRTSLSTIISGLQTDGYRLDSHCYLPPLSEVQVSFSSCYPTRSLLVWQASRCHLP